MAHHLLSEILILLAVSVVFVALFRRLHLPPVLGYLVVGMLIGPHALGWFEHSEATHLLGEIGVAFLLFAIGLEFSIPQFIAMRNILLGLGAAQVLGGTLAGAFIVWWIGIPPTAAIIVGGALAMSSTAIVVKQLTDQIELQARHGNMALGILLFQDLAAVPFLVAIPILAANSEQGLGLALLFALGKALVAFAVMLALGHWLLRRLFHEVAAARSTELFTLTVLLVSLFAAWFTGLLGLSLALGAFLAGMMLSETEYRHQIEVELRPFKDILLGLFFIIVGMQLNFAVLLSLWPWVLLLVVGLIIGKGCLITLLALAYGRNREVAVRTGLVLAHGGEFGFALLALAISSGLLSARDSQPILAAIVVTMLIAPILIRYNQTLSLKLLPRPPQNQSQTQSLAKEIAAAVEDKKQHIVICGFGRVGSQIARLLDGESIPYVALDLHPSLVKHAWEEGKQVFYGDATRRSILHAVGIERASALVISFDGDANALKILHNARALHSDIPILVRSRDDSNLEIFMRTGATEVIPETFEASVMLTTHLLILLKTPDEKIEDLLETVRNDRYLMLRDM